MADSKLSALENEYNELSLKLKLKDKVSPEALNA